MPPKNALPLFIQKVGDPHVVPRDVGIGKLRKIAFLGSHQSIHYAPWFDPSWELWSHASTRTLCKRTPDRIFDVHPKEIRSTKKGQAYWNKIKNSQVPIYMAERYPDIPAAVRYPVEMVLSIYQPPGENVFTSHAAWMFALALMEGVTDIGIWGISYGAGEEREAQRESLIHWIGYARGQGVRVHLPHYGKHRVVIHTKPMELYGYESHDKNGVLVPSYRPTKAGLDTAKGPVELTVHKDPDASSIYRANVGQPRQSSLAPWNYYKTKEEKEHDRRSKRAKAAGKASKASAARKVQRRTGRAARKSRQRTAKS